MYKDDYNNEFPYKNFLLRFILIIIAVALVICIITVLTRKNQNIEANSGTDAIFSDNLERIKVEALNYYNESNIPKEVGKSTKLTLDQMIEKKLLTPIKDRDNKLCSGKKSFIKLTKKNDEYQLKVNLSCDNDEDYMILHLNKNTYCTDTYLCENKATKTEDNNEVSNNEEQQEQESEKNYEYIPNTTTKTKKITRKYTTSKKTKKIRKTKIIKTNKGSITVTDTTAKYKYEYVKNSSYKLSNWSAWTGWKKTNCNTSKIKCNDNDYSCLKELERFDRKEIIDSYSKAYTVSNNNLKHTGNINKTMCSNYNYVIIDDVVYRLTSSQDYNLINNIGKSTKKTTGGWKYNGEKSYIEPQSDTYNTRYILIGLDYSECANTCNGKQKYRYDKYTYSKDIARVDSITCSKNKNISITTYNRKKEVITFTREEKLYGTVCYKNERTRSLISSGSIIKKWSKYNDRSLLDNGYSYTGNRKSS